MKIKDYFPQGYGAIRLKSTQSTRTLPKESFNPIRPAAPRTYTTPQKTNLKVYDHNAILNLWVEGLSGPEIGKRLGLPLPTTAGGIVASCRKAGDPRALSRSTNSSKIVAAYARKRAIT